MMYAMVDNNINHLQFLGLQGSAYNQIAYMEASGKSLNVIGCVTGSNLSCTSDSTLKTDITKYNPNLENLSSLECVTFRWKDLPQTPFTADSNSKQVGLIAQEVEKAFPELVYTDSRGYKAISYNGLNAMPFGNSFRTRHTGEGRYPGACKNLVPSLRRGDCQCAS